MDPQQGRGVSRRTSGKGSGAPTRLMLSALLLATACLGRDHLRDADPVNSDLTIHVVIENPVGSNEKWEVRADGRLVQEHDARGPIQIPYLPWPANGGMVPRTLLSEELGGDGEPLDVLVLGPSLARGTLVRAVPIGLLEVVDRLERDDKILAIWYDHSRPGGAIEVQGYGSRAEARRLIAECAREFVEAERSGTLPEWRTP